jgi:ABC-2 type transport system ATP-binding protein
LSIEVLHLKKTYGTQHAVDDISFKVGKGEILGFLGPNGAGKSTTMKIATCYIPPSEGTIRVAGFDILDAPGEIRKVIGYLPEHDPLYLDMYVSEYLHFVGSVHHLKGKILKENISRMIEICGLSKEYKKKIGALSKGYRQRVGLAQALIHDPQVLILDEPTTGLDPNQILEIRNLIRNLGKEKTVIFSTHILQEVQAICERVIIINRGKIVADSPVKDLTTSQNGRRIILLEFEQDVNVETLNNHPDVSGIVSKGNGKYEVSISQHKDLRSEIFKLASENQWPLLGIRQEEITLENIFRDLTEKKQ